MLPTILLAALILATIVITSPLPRTIAVTAADIIHIDPNTASCTAAPAADECRTAAEAAPCIAISFTNYGITSFGEQAALLALMLYESGDFKYSRGQFPGVPGQGTRNMQSPAYNLKYAEYLATVCTNCGITPTQVQQAESQGPAVVLALVNTDEWSFGSAAWFLATQCDASVRQSLSLGTRAGWEAYLQCVGTEDNEERDGLWNAAMALGDW